MNIFACVQRLHQGGTGETEALYQYSELDYLIYNAPESYAWQILNSNSVAYLKAVTEYMPLD